jgi:hypothetical protein
MRLLPTELYFDFANTNTITGTQALWLMGWHPCTIERRAIHGTQVFEQVLTVLLNNQGMIARRYSTVVIG